MPGQNFKIAICVSGLTRTWNDLIINTDRSGIQPSMARMMKDLQERGHEVHMYGHYWDYDTTPLPPIDQEFKALRSTNQDAELRAWVAEDIMGRAVLNDGRSLRDLKHFKQQYNLDTVEKFNEWILDETVDAIAQYFQNCLCMEQIDWSENYDLIIRTRWDTVIEVPGKIDKVVNFEHDINFLKNFMYNYLEAFARGVWPDPGNKRPLLLLPSTGYVQYSPKLENRFYCHDQPEDIFFVFKNKEGNQFLQSLKTDRWRHNAERVIGELSLDQRCGGHNFWNTIFQITGLPAAYGLPGIFSLCRSV